ncbi:hypothetical protein D3C78_1590860 [compost metagenome]
MKRRANRAHYLLHDKLTELDLASEVGIDRSKIGQAFHYSAKSNDSELELFSSFYHMRGEQIVNLLVQQRIP